MAEILDEVAPRAWSDLLACTVDPGDAHRALQYAARLLDWCADRLPAERASVSEQRDRSVREVIDRCRQLRSPRVRGDVERGGDRGRLSELLAATTDLVATMNPPLSAGEHWAVRTALLDPICACAGVLRELDASAPLIHLDSALSELRRWTGRCPPTAQDAARLDQARPTTLPEPQGSVRRLQQLIDAIAYRAETSELHPGDGRLIAAPGLHVAIYAKPITALLSPGDSDTLIGCDQMTAAWFALRDALRETTRHSGLSELSSPVADLSAGLVHAFGHPATPDPTHAGQSSADLATTYRGLVNRLPALAQKVAAEAGRWGSRRLTPELESDVPIGWRTRAGVLQFAGVAPTRMRPLIASVIAERALQAAQQSTGVAVHADRSAMRLGHQRHPHLARAHLEQTDALTRPSPDATPEVRWRTVVAALDVRVTEDLAWPALARVLDRAALAGWDARTQLASLARDLPERQTAVELTCRVLEHCPLEPVTLAHRSRPERGTAAHRRMPAQSTLARTPSPAPPGTRSATRTSWPR
ncbi:MAG: hypothetical protein ACR2LF_13575 [Jatrophihabitantaceae bacterium]